MHHDAVLHNLHCHCALERASSRTFANAPDGLGYPHHRYQSGPSPISHDRAATLLGWSSSISNTSYHPLLILCNLLLDELIAYLSVKPKRNRSDSLSRASRKQRPAIPRL